MLLGEWPDKSSVGGDSAEDARSDFVFREALVEYTIAHHTKRALSMRILSRRAGKRKAPSLSPQPNLFGVVVISHPSVTDDWNAQVLYGVAQTQCTKSPVQRQ